MDDLLFSLNATLPIFIMMMLGYFLRRVGIVTQEFADAANTFVFKICLPLVLFDDLYQMDIQIGMAQIATGFLCCIYHIYKVRMHQNTCNGHCHIRITLELLCC